MHNRKVQLIDETGTSIEIEETDFGARLSTLGWLGTPVESRNFVRPDSAGPLRAAVENAFQRAFLRGGPMIVGNYERLEDNREDRLAVELRPGVATLFIESGNGNANMRTAFAAGGKSPRTYAALIELARAIEADNASFPAWNELGGGQ